MYSKADTHIHTTYSDGFKTPQETVDFIAAQTDLRVIAITDHDTTEGAFIARAYAEHHAPHLEVIIGQEVTTDEGDVIGLFLQSTLPAFATAAAAVAAIHAQGGLAVAPHPFSRWVTCNYIQGVGAKIFELPFDAVEAYNGLPANLISNPVTAWLNRRLGQGLAELGGSDSHAPCTVGQPFTWFPGQTALDFRRAVENRTARPGGWLWSIRGTVQFIPFIFKKRTPAQKERVFSD